ncbi:HlyD family type I secretion periplasmic adaptor subunit [Octadecabacter sp. G9-8]|uniref:Membrane fusion protein (MFP) family protein n=1 Tax=Octadecabacter dasysiphoniae TaxID=2909341 RepID=A0ABS9CYS3_9RHOB|nr:HlyD family type I secretion periplasmic adaptor subunit [Octadecabacter dasysiphoniae]MCF2872308.1 HlyD family type I secretion periplasmic adaptor subunit [Octadecabacter dasysiphoniae]
MGRELDDLTRELRGRMPVRASLLLLAIFSFFVLAVLWAANAELDDVTRAEGRVVPSGDLQVIQATEQGVLRALYVGEGEIVESGDILMELDGELLTGQLDQELQRAHGLRARIQRLRAEIDGSNLTFSTELAALAPDVVSAEAALYSARRTELQGQIDILERRREQRIQENTEAEVDLATAQDMASIATEERALLEPLVQRGLEPETSILALRRTEAEVSGTVTRAGASLARFQSALAEIDDQIAAERNRYRAEAMSDLALATNELAALNAVLPSLETRAGRAVMRAPVRGVVNLIHRTTIGAAVQRGEELIEIVPLEGGLSIEAYVRPSDIAFLRPDQPVKINLTAYDFSRYGALDGVITRIGADAVTRSERDEQAVFVISIRTEDTLTDVDGADVTIIPGMIAEVDILAGRKTVLDYLIRPVIRVKDRAFLE